MFELHSMSNYAGFQSKKAIPLMAKMLNTTPEEMLKQPIGMPLLKAFRQATDEKFGVDEKGKPNTSNQDDPRWDYNNPESDALADELVKRAFELVNK